MLVFRRQGFRRSSIEQAAEAAGLTRQALYHHFKSKEALFRAVIERLHESALAAEIDSGQRRGESRRQPCRYPRRLGQRQARATGRVARRARRMSRSCSPNICCRPATSTRNMPPPTRRSLRLPSRASAASRASSLNAGMTPRDLARCVEMAINGTKSAYPAMQPAGAFLKDLEIMLRTLVAGATSPAAEAARRHNDSCQERSDRQIRSIHLPQTWRSQMSTMTINGTLAPLPDDPDALLDRCRAGRARPHRHQARLRRRRLRRLHRAGRRRTGRELPDACARRGRQIDDDGRRHRRRQSCTRCRRPSWRTTPCNAASARRASSSRPRRFTIAGGRAKGTAAPSREEIGAALSGHLCRCGAYDGIFRAVADGLRRPLRRRRHRARRAWKRATR